MVEFPKSLVQDEAGATSIEYGLIALLISIVAFAGFEALGASFSSMLEIVSSGIQSAVQK